MNKDYKFNPEMYKTVAKNVRKYRKEKGLSLEELSKQTEIKKEFLQNFELAETNMPISIYDLYKISIILETRIDHFFIEEELI